MEGIDTSSLRISSSSINSRYIACRLIVSFFLYGLSTAGDETGSSGRGASGKKKYTLSFTVTHLPSQTHASYSLCDLMVDTAVNPLEEEQEGRSESMQSPPEQPPLWDEIR